MRHGGCEQHLGREFWGKHRVQAGNWWDIAATGLGTTLRRGEACPCCARQEDGWRADNAAVWACRVPSPALFHAMDIDLNHQPKHHPKSHLAPPAHPSDVLSIPRWDYVTEAATMGKSIGLFQTCAPGWAYTISPRCSSCSLTSPEPG